MMCALQAGQRHRRILILDHSEKIGRKILISGGGRCNFTNIGATPANFHSANPHFAKSALARFTPQDFISMVRKHRIPYHEKKLGQLFCDRSAQEIVDMLVKECKQAGVKFMMGTKIKGVAKTANGFDVHTERGTYSSDSLVIATGGLSIPPVGATGFGYEIARQFGCRKAVFRENTLFTHTGLSGPAILQASLYWHSNDPLTIDVCPQTDLRTFLEKQRHNKSTKELKNVLSDILRIEETFPALVGFNLNKSDAAKLKDMSGVAFDSSVSLPKRLAEKLCEVLISSKPINQYNDKEVDDICAALQAWKLVPASNFGYAKAEVTRGGVSTDELSSKDMMAKKVPGLFFIGEVVDVTGQLGGYNFQWAWASGHAVGMVI